MISNKIKAIVASLMLIGISSSAWSQSETGSAAEAPAETRIIQQAQILVKFKNEYTLIQKKGILAELGLVGFLKANGTHDLFFTKMNPEMVIKKLNSFPYIFEYAELNQTYRTMPVNPQK